MNNIFLGEPPASIKRFIEDKLYTVITKVNGTVEKKLIKGQLTWESIGKSGQLTSDSTIKSVKIGTAVTSIDLYAFYNCSSLTSIDIPDSVISIGDGAFSNCPNIIVTFLGRTRAQVNAMANYSWSLQSSQIVSG